MSLEKYRSLLLLLLSIQRDIKNADIDIETAEGAIWDMLILFYFNFF